MKTDDWSNRRRDAADSSEAKVVRLRDWLGPEEELVPIGPRADRPRPAQDEPAAEPEPGAGFWEGDASLQTAVPAPALRAEPRRAALSSRVRARATVSWGWLAAGSAVAALVIVALVVVTGGGGNAPTQRQTEEAAIGTPLGPGLTKTVHKAAAATHAAARKGAKEVLAQARRKHRIALRHKRARAAKARRRRQAAAAAAAAAAAQSSSPVSEPAQTSTTPAYSETETTAPAPTETEPVQTTPVETPPTTTPSPPSGGGGGSSSGGGSNSSSSHTPAVGAGGSLAPGSSPDG